jgi:hypothetical protein
MTARLVLSLAFFSGWTSQEEPLPTSEQFVRLTHSLFADVADVSFEFEAETRYVGSHYLPKERVSRLGKSVQGTASYRSDGAVFVESYVASLGPDSSLIQRVDALVGNIWSRQTWDPDSRQNQTSQKRGSLRALADAESPFRYFRGWYFTQLQDPVSYHYQALRWEQYEDHRCLVVDLSMLPSIPGSTPVARPFYRYWMDLERGGHPIRIEGFEGDRRIAATQVRLRQIALAGGRRIWFPERGIHESFRWDDQIEETPTFRSQCLFLLDTARWNQSLPDSVFTLKGRSPVVPSGILASTIQEFEKQKSAPPKPPDTRSVQERIDAALADADAQARPLDASSKASTSNAWGSAPRIALISGGVITLVMALSLWRRR